MIGRLSDEEIAAAVAEGRRRLDRAPAERIEMHVGGRVWFAGVEGVWSVRAVSADGRWVICTQPVPLDVAGWWGGSWLYTVIDWDSGVRGPDNCHGLGYENDEEIAESLAMFEAGDAEVSVRSDVYLDIAAYSAPAVGS